jgi:hypothetical protein
MKANPADEEGMKAKPVCTETFQRRPGYSQAVATIDGSIETLRDSVWAKKVIHGESLMRISREIGRRYIETEDLFVEAAMEYGLKMYRHGVRFGRTMPRVHPIALRAS